MMALKALGMIVAGIMWVISAIFTFGITLVVGVAIFAIARKLVRKEQDMPAKAAFFDLEGHQPIQRP